MNQQFEPPDDDDDDVDTDVWQDEEHGEPVGVVS